MTEEAISWRAITVDSEVIATDGPVIGKVTEVAALQNEDIFHGVVFHHHALGKHLLAPASDVDTITVGTVHLSVDSETASAYDEFHPLLVERLGLRGAFRWKHLGWKSSDE